MSTDVLSLVIAATDGEVASVSATHFRDGRQVSVRDIFTSTPKANALRERIARLVTQLRAETRRGG